MAVNNEDVAPLEALQKHNAHVQSLSLTNSLHAWWPFGDRVTRFNESGLFFDHWLAPEAPAVAVQP